MHLQYAKQLLDNLHALLQACRNDFSSFYATTVSEAKRLRIADPVVPRTVRRPARLAEGATNYAFESPESYYRHLFFDQVDNASAVIAGRFNTEIFTFLEQVEIAIVKSSLSTKIISDFYGDVGAERLQLHVRMFHDVIRSRNTEVTAGFIIADDWMSAS